jgi:hypothetical protein
VFTGTLPPNAATNIPVTLGAGATNLSISLAGTANAYGFLFLRKDAAPTDLVYDFSAQTPGQTNSLSLEQPEFSTGTWHVRVRNPLAGIAAYTLVVETNRNDLRTSSRPVSKRLPGTAPGSIGPGAWQYFRLEMPASTFWKARLDVTNQSLPDLYVNRTGLPTTSSYLRRSLNVTNDLIAFASSQVTPGVYYIGIYGGQAGSGNATFTLVVDSAAPRDLVWDPGTTHFGTQVYTNLSGQADDYFFRIITANPASGGWRTALRTFKTNDANLYLSRGTLPTPDSADFKSERTGSDGLVLSLSTQAAPNEEWFILVRANAGAEWSLVSGAPFVTDLGTVAADSSSGSGNVDIGPEGFRFFSTSIPSDILAWQLYLNGRTNVIYLKKTSVPLAQQGLNEMFQSGQALIVPPYLSAGQYFIGIAGAPETVINLASRRHIVQDLVYGSELRSSMTGFAYATFRVQVPPQQIAWQMYVSATNANANMSVRRNTVPNENNNDACSEMTAQYADHITLVPPVLSDGTFYVTVYSTNVLGSNVCSFWLTNGPAVITDIPYAGVVINEDVARIGWRFYRVTDIARQLNSLGWELLLTNAPPGTVIALRRNMAPSFWSARPPASGALVNYYDRLSNANFLQSPDQQADVWYVGVYNPVVPLGDFVLTTRDLQAGPLTDNVALPRTNALSGRWEFYRVQLTAQDLQASGNTGPVLGWDIRLTDVASGTPQLVVRRERLPSSTGSTLVGGSSAWPSGGQWAAGKDWTKRTFSPDGKTNEDGRILAMGLHRPLEPGTYYIGVLNNDPTNAASYKILSRWIGSGRSIPVEDIAWSGGRATNSLPPREAAYYRVIIPPTTPSWKVRLHPSAGESMMIVTTTNIPAIDSEKRMQKPGAEHYVMLPGQTTNYLAPTTNYLTVVGEGGSPLDNNRIGNGPSTFVIESAGAMPETNLGMLDGADLVITDTLEGGESTAYHFQTRPGCLGFWILLEDTTGAPWAVSRGEIDLADPGLGGDLYGNEGGKTSGAISSPGMITVADPYPIETIMVKARALLGAYADATYTLRVKEILPEPLAFDGGVATIAEDSYQFSRFYHIAVPQDAQGWDVRLNNVTGTSPILVASRDFLPIFTTTFGFVPNPFSARNWPSGARWPANLDWTERRESWEGVNESGRVLAMGMNRPLEPGNYYVGVLGGSSSPLGCKVQSRGIGTNYTLPVKELSFAGGSVSETNVPARDATYYRVRIPANTRSWRVKLEATSGESLLMVLKDTLPNVGAALNTSITNSGGRKMQKLGDEEFALFPYPGQEWLLPGDYFLAVASEGQGVVNASRIGYGSSSYTITSAGEIPVAHLGDLANGELVATNALKGGQVCVYQFNVPPGVPSLEARLESRVGNPMMTLSSGARVPDPGAMLGQIQVDAYGNEGGVPPGQAVGEAQLNVANPTNGLFTLVVKARATSAYAPVTVPDASYTLRLYASSTFPVDFDQGAAVVVNQPRDTWRFFRVTVPTNACGWDVRLVDVTKGLPRIIVRRESLPSGLLTTPWSSPGTQTYWPTNAQWAPLTDWTRRSSSVDGLVNEDGRILAAGLNRPLVPGTYIVGVINTTPSTNMSYTLLSRGIGNEFSIPLLDLPFQSAFTNAALAARDAAYYRVLIPSNTPNWKVKLTGIVGESMLAVLRGGLPNFDTVNSMGTVTSGKAMQKLGNENFLVLPAPGQTNILAGTNYLAVISEGVNPGTSARIGSGTSSYVITSMGTMVPVDLGLLTSEDLVLPDTLEGGEAKAYRFHVPPGMYGVSLRLENRAGNPVLVAQQGERLPDPSANVPGAPTDAYGTEGGGPVGDGGPTIATLPNPVPGVYSVLIKGRASGSPPIYPDAQYTLRIQEILTPELNFTSSQNTNGLSNEISGLLQDNERAFFKIVIPATNNGQPVIGWKLDLSQSSGQALMRVRRDSLPSDATSGTLMPFTAASAIIAPPFLTNGVWFVEVKASGSTTFNLRSSALELERPAWVMSAPGETGQTPGVTLPDFGDTGIGTNGVPLTGDQGITLEQGGLHYYAVQVPATNNGLLRAQLIAISGNPDLYLRLGAVPTLYHNALGSSGTIHDRTMLAASFTEYANWVPLDGKLETQLKPGLWYIAVRAAGNANARYRLVLSTGNIVDLPLNSDGVTNQVVAGGDWVYCRMPTPSALPLTFSVTFSQERGTVTMHLRDTVPPGNGATPATFDVKDWNTDAKNFGPYPNLSSPGTYTFKAPPVRPGRPLYLGFRGAADSSIAVRVTTDGSPTAEPAVVDFYGGFAATNVPPTSAVLFRVDAPPEAVRWKHTSTHTTNLTVYIDQGTIPTRTATRWTSMGANSSYNTPLVAWNNTLKKYLPAYWPWVAGQSYFIVVTNSSAMAQDFMISMDGKNAETDDLDLDGLPDAWELYYWGNTGQVGGTDNDADSISNYDEYLEGTDPLNANSYRARLFISASNGTVQQSPSLASYPLGTEVLLTAVPFPAYSFIGWGGDMSGTQNPVTVVMSGHKTLYAKFKLAGDDFMTALPLAGTDVIAYGTNISFTKEPGEPNHGGNPGGKSIWWRWTAPESGPVSISTAGSSFSTLLAVYTGQTVSNLTAVASDINSTGGTNRSRVTFEALAGTTYNIAVDGYNGASSRITLSLTTSGATVPLQLSDLLRLEDGTMQFIVLGDANRTYVIEETADLSDWHYLFSVTTSADGTAIVFDPAATEANTRFYRARSQ